MGQLALHPDSLPSLAKCVSDIVQDRVAGVLSSPPSSGKPASSARCKLCQYPSDPGHMHSATASTVKGTICAGPTMSACTEMA